MDVNTHVRAVSRHRWLVLCGALAAGLLVLAVRLMATPVWTATAELYLVPSPDADPTEISRLTDVYTALADNRLVLLSTEAGAGLLRLDREQIRAATGVEKVSSGLLSATGQGSSADRAATLTNAYGQALSRAVDLDQRRAQQLALTPLDAQLTQVEEQLSGLTPQDAGYDALAQQRAALQASRASLLSRGLTRLDVLAEAEGRNAARTPQPARDALLAFLVMLIVLSELVVLRAVRQGRLDGPALPATLERRTDLPVLRIGAQGQQASAVLALVLAGEKLPHTVLVLPLDPSRAALDVAVRLASAAQHTGRRTVVVEVADALHSAGSLADGVTRLSPTPLELSSQARLGVLAGTRQDDLVVVALPSWDAPQALSVAPLPALRALVVDAREVRSSTLDESLRVLRLAGMPADVILLTERAPRRLRFRRRRHEVAPVKAGARKTATRKTRASGAPADRVRA